MAKRLGIIPPLFAQPLFYGLNKSKGHAGSFELLSDLPAQLAVKLRARNLDAAFLSPIDYAKDYAMYSIIPNIGIASQAGGGAVFVIFKENLHTVTSLAVNPVSSSEIVLAHIILSEKVGSRPTIIPFAGPIEKALSIADGVLCVGDDAFVHRDHPRKLDLVEEWSDLTELPFVHGIWVARENALSSAECHEILASAHEGKAQIDHLPGGVDYLSQFQYDMDELSRAGLAEFFRMAYYHGILQDIPDIRFLTLGESKSHAAGELN